jgi:hypothetical protein
MQMMMEVSLEVHKIIVMRRRIHSCNTLLKSRLPDNNVLYNAKHNVCYAPRRTPDRCGRILFQTVKHTSTFSENKTVHHSVWLGIINTIDATCSSNLHITTQFEPDSCSRLFQIGKSSSGSSSSGSSSSGSSPSSS